MVVFGFFGFPSAFVWFQLKGCYRSWIFRLLEDSGRIGISTPFRFFCGFLGFLWVLFGFFWVLCGFWGFSCVLAGV